MTDQKQTFDAVRWLASEILLRSGALQRLVDGGLEAFMADCPFDDFTPAQAATVIAMMNNKQARTALFDYWTAYDVGRLSGEVPDARTLVAAADNPWLD